MGQPEVLQRIDPPAAEVAGEQIGLIDLEPGLQSQLALPRVAVRLEDLVVNGFAQVGERRIGRPALLGQLRELLARDHRLHVGPIGAFVERLHDQTSSENSSAFSMAWRSASSSSLSPPSIATKAVSTLMRATRTRWLTRRRLAFMTRWPLFLALRLTP